MPSSYTLGLHFESFVQGQLASGRYASASEVIRDGLRLLEEREARNAALHQALREGLADAEAGRVYDANEVFGELTARYEAMAAAREQR